MAQAVRYLEMLDDMELDLTQDHGKRLAWIVARIWEGSTMDRHMVGATVTFTDGSSVEIVAPDEMIED